MSLHLKVVDSYGSIRSYKMCSLLRYTCVFTSSIVRYAQSGGICRQCELTYTFPWCIIDVVFYRFIFIIHNPVNL